MKKFLGMIILALVFTSFIGLTPKANKEIQFEKITFNQALAKAKKENKMKTVAR